MMNSNDLLATLSAEVNTYIDTLRGHTVSKQMTEQMNILYPINWTHNTAEELFSFQHMLSRKLAAEICCSAQMFQICIFRYTCENRKYQERIK